MRRNQVLAASVLLVVLLASAAAAQEERPLGVFGGISYHFADGMSEAQSALGVSINYWMTRGLGIQGAVCIWDIEDEKVLPLLFGALFRMVSEGQSYYPYFGGGGGVYMIGLGEDWQETKFGFFVNGGVQFGRFFVEGQYHRIMDVDTNSIVAVGGIRF